MKRFYCGYCGCPEMAKNVLFWWNIIYQISSNQKYLILQNHFQLGNFDSFLKSILHECQASCKFEYFFSSFVLVCDTTQCITLIVQWFYLQRNKGPSVLLSARIKKVAIKLHKNQKLNLGNQYHKDVKNVAHQIDETLNETQIKYPKIVEALDRIL